MANVAKYSERETGKVTFQLKDIAKKVIQPSTLDLLIMTIHRDVNGVRQFIRSSDDLLTDPAVEIAEDGTVTWNVQSYETRYEGEADAEIGDSQDKEVTIEFVYDSPQTGTITDPFATTQDSRTVVVTHPNHGLSVNDDISFNAPAAIGGIDFAGRYIVENVLGINSYEILTLKAATATASGGGQVPWFHGGQYRPELATLEITRVDPVG
ncbi:MAG: hypothetical protein ACYTGL_14765 [Planctomycetota bacterium]|jgi:hypothetical protein